MAIGWLWTCIPFKPARFKPARLKPPRYVVMVCMVTLILTFSQREKGLEFNG